MRSFGPEPPGFEQRWGQRGGSDLEQKKPSTCGFPGQQQQVTANVLLSVLRMSGRTSAVILAPLARRHVGRGLSALDPLQVNLYRRLARAETAEQKYLPPARIGSPHLNYLPLPLVLVVALFDPHLSFSS